MQSAREAGFLQASRDLGLSSARGLLVPESDNLLEPCCSSPPLLSSVWVKSHCTFLGAVGQFTFLFTLGTLSGQGKSNQDRCRVMTNCVEPKKK